MKIRGKQLGAHRVAWRLAHGPIPPGLYVCHRCDVPSCINPRHLFLGSARDNMRDCVRKQRNLARVHPELVHCGESSGGSKLSLDQVKDILSAAAVGVPRKELARRYSVDLSTIAVIVTGKTWRRALAKAPRETP